MKYTALVILQKDEPLNDAEREFIHNALKVAVDRVNRNTYVNAELVDTDLRR